MKPCAFLAAFLLLTISPMVANSSDSNSRDGDRGAPAVGFGASVLAHNGSVYVSRSGISTRFQEPVSQTGAVHVYAKSGDEWVETRLLSAAEGAFGDYFGRSMTAAGAQLAVSAPLKDRATGAVYIFDMEGDASNEIRMIRAAESKPGDSLGWSISASGNVLVAGAPGAASGVGAVHIFRRAPEGPGWVHVTWLDSPFGEGSRFGASVSVDGDHLLVGAPGANGGKGRAVVYRSAENSWKELARLESNGDATRFGTSVDLRSGIAAVGAPMGGGAVQTYQMGEWKKPVVLQAASGQQTAEYGSAVHLAGDEVWIGAPNSGGSGTIYRYRKGESGKWQPVENVVPYPLAPGAGYGDPFSVSGSLAAMGVTNVEFGSGRAYVFERNPAGTWVETGNMTNSGIDLDPITGSKRECEEGKVDAFSCDNVELLSFLPVDAIGGIPGVTAADIWGWTDPETKREYALANRSDGTAFVDITDPVNPIYVGDLPTTPGSVPNIWRDVKTYKNYALIVADNVGDHGMQIFDLTLLRDVENPPVVFEPSALYRGIQSAHNVIVNEETGFAYIVGADGGGNSCGGELHMVDVRDPMNPKFAGCFNHVSIGQGTHDSQCVVYRGPDHRYHGREICFSSNATALSIADVTDKKNPVPLASATYPSVGYAHQGWLTDDQRYFYQDDEGDELNTDFGGTRTIVWDVAELDDPVLLTEFINQNKASDHNLYVKGDLMYQSNYVGGLRIIDISDRGNPREVGHFDTMPYGDDAPGFAGAWSNYPFFESGNIIVSSIREGLFVVRKADEIVP